MSGPKTAGRYDPWTYRAAIVWLVSGLMWFALEGLTAAEFRGYSYARDFISDLGVPVSELTLNRQFGSPLAVVMNVNLVAHGLLFLAGAIFVSRSAVAGTARYAFLAFAVVQAIGGVLVGIVHDSAWADVHGILEWHRLGAGLAIYGSNIAIVIAGLNAGRFGAASAYRLGSIALGAIGVVCFSLLVFGPDTSIPVGAFERVAAYPIMLWEIVTGLTILFSGRSSARSGQSGTARGAAV